MGYEDVYNEAVSKQSKTIRTVVLVCNLETDITQLVSSFIFKRYNCYQF